MKRSKLLDKVWNEIRASHFSYSTEKSYLGWIYRFIVYHDKRHPAEMGKQEISEFLTYLAVQRKVSASSQNQALICHSFTGERI